MNKIALFAFNGELMCFVHILLNALDMSERGHEVKIIIEGSATRLIPELVKPDNPMSGLFKKAKDRNLIEGACKACSNKMGTLEAVQTEGLKLLDDMAGHPAIAGYQERGFQVLTF